MNCRMGELRNKEVINIRNGVKIGYVSDIEINTNDATLSAIIIYGRMRWFGLLGRENDIVIGWDKIQMMGGDAVLVDFEEPEEVKKKNAVLQFLEKIKF